MKSVRVLMVTTSHKSVGDTSPDTGIWLQELAGPYYVFKDAGSFITLASPKGGVIPIDSNSESSDAVTVSTRRFHADDQAMYHLGHSLPLHEVSGKTFDLVFITGGRGSMSDLKNDIILTGLLDEFADSGKPISAVGSGVVALLSMQNKNKSAFVEGKKLTAFSNAETQMQGLTYMTPFLLESELLSKGAYYSRSPDYKTHTVTDGNLVTGQNAASSVRTATEVLAMALKIQHDTDVENNPDMFSF